MNGFLLDTNIFNHLVEGKISINDLPIEFPIFVTPAQYEEIISCPDMQKRSELYSWLKIIVDNVISENLLNNRPKDIMPPGLSQEYQNILTGLNLKNRKRVKANSNDALIGALSLKNELILVTNDMALAQIVRARGGYVRSISF